MVKTFPLPKPRGEAAKIYAEKLDDYLSSSKYWKSIFILRWYEEMNYDEIALALGLDEASVMQTCVDIRAYARELAQTIIDKLNKEKGKDAKK